MHPDVTPPETPTPESQSVRQPSYNPSTTQQIRRLATQIAQGPKPGLNAASERYHGLDALRAFALLLGVLLHAAINFVLKPGPWAVGVSSANPFMGWLIYYLHSFRLEVFFLLAGFFAALVLQRSGVRVFLRDRAVRILLVFVILLYPMKYALSLVWIWGGLSTGWLQIDGTRPSVFRMGFHALNAEPWPHIRLTHLWFLYYLTSISILFLGLRFIASRIPALQWFDATLHRILASSPAGFWIALALTPIMARMNGTDIDTPDNSLVLHRTVLVVYTLFFSLGAWLYRHTDLFTVIASRWGANVTTGLAVSVATSFFISMRIENGPWAQNYSQQLLWATSFGTSVAMAHSVLGWLGCFLSLVQRPSARLRYLVDSSYWIYIAHLPLVAALQVLLAPYRLAWWWQVPIVTLTSVVLLLLVFHFAVRDTWLGTWLRGRPRKQDPPPKPIVSPIPEQSKVAVP